MRCVKLLSTIAFVKIDRFQGARQQTTYAFAQKSLHQAGAEPQLASFISTTEKFRFRTATLSTFTTGRIRHEWIVLQKDTAHRNI